MRLAWVLVVCMGCGGAVASGAGAEGEDGEQGPDDVYCAAVPSCPQGFTTYWTREECEAADGGACTETERCGSVAYCRSERDPGAEPEPPEDPIETGDPP